MTQRELVEHRPPLGAHRLLGYGAGSALIRPDGEIDWWCRDRFDATPLLWSLLDRAGGSSRWQHATIAQWDQHPAGPTAHTVIHIGPRRVELWDGLLADGDTNVLVRLARSEAGPPFEMTHRISVGGFDASWQTWTLRHCTAISEQLAITGRHSAAVHGRELHTAVQVTSDAWNGIVFLDPHSSLVTTDVAAWVETLREAEREEERFLDNIRLPHDHPSRVIDALRVLRVLTDRRTGAPIASPTTSLPEAPGGSRQYDYRYAWLRDAAYAVATAALLGRPQAAASYLEFVSSLVDRYGSDLPPLTTTDGSPVPQERDIDGVAGWANSPRSPRSATSTPHAPAPTTCASTCLRSWQRNGQSNKTKHSATRPYCGHTPKQHEPSTTSTKNGSVTDTARSVSNSGESFVICVSDFCQHERPVRSVRPQPPTRTGAGTACAMRRPHWSQLRPRPARVSAHQHERLARTHMVRERPEQVGVDHSPALVRAPSRGSACTLSDK